jgi:carboxypeptidase C (cathepsin A)
LYLAGTSYAGHYVPAFAAHLTRINSPYINFSGAAIGNGWMDQYEQNLYFSEFLRYNGIVSFFGALLMKFGELLCGIVHVTGMQKFDIACDKYSFFVVKQLGIQNPYDISRPNTTIFFMQLDWVEKYLDKPEVKKLLGVEGQTYRWFNADVNKMMANDSALSLSEDIAYSLNKGKRLIFFFGDKDYVCNWMGGYSVMKKIPWKYNSEFRNADLNLWKNSAGKEMGKIQSYNKLTYISVNDAGHSIFATQQEAGFHILEKLIEP